jgi:hypothetical protein
MNGENQGKKIEHRLPPAGGSMIRTNLKCEP